ncbi:MAG TPA: PP2C family protein-serine/threonine phosphatase [Thermoanaerobaculia bacterium]|jgi:serine phosphatase RsbU (regulator of sigma subunit)|nr:PP2C family protein-serine/threonine phosphatase [Thermoanaerobaculia bacterium]
MKSPTLDELVMLPEPLALHRQLDARNYRTFRWLLVVVALCTLAGIAASADLHDGWGLVLYPVDLILCTVLFVLRDRDLFARNFRQLLLGFLCLEILVLKLAASHIPAGDGDVALFIMVVFLLLAFRLRLAEHVMLYGFLWVVAVFPLSWVGLRPAGAAPVDQGETVAVSILSVICLAGALGLTQLERRRFLAVWRQEHSRYRERLRMREEIDYARKIQLSMLPQGSPEVDWLELAAASLPATEVGGDYYDYFLLAPSQLALVLGDVSGHGLASGLLLSGVRSCLYLLEPSLGAPIPVFEKLNQMVRRTTERRTYMTLLCAVLDCEAATLTVTSAGHPPVLRYDSRQRCFEEIGQGSPPLGTFLQADYVEDRRPVASGDLLIFCTDGLVEARNAQGQDYGDDRLRRAVARAADSRTAREVRDAILGDLSNFKGDEEQSDDITVVVVRLRWPARDVNSDPPSP